MKGKLKIVVHTFLMIMFIGCSNSSSIVYSSDTLVISKIKKGVYIHTSYLNTNNYGKVGCNGMIVVSKNEAIVCDTPSDDRTAEELIQWITSDAMSVIRAVVVTHFHVDCLGGLKTFHKKGISSYSNIHTITLAKEKGEIVPQNGFEDSIKLPVGDAQLISAYHGAGHTLDNIICYYGAEQVMFGGCLVKAIGAGKGNLDDADVGKWSNTVREIKATYGDVDIVIPGHGLEGDIELLNFTIDLFDIP